jgi:hypothetical protein
MKKFEFHLDALITVIVVFALAISFILYQRHQFSEVFQENIDLVWEVETLKVDLELKSRWLDRCENKITSAENISAD